jgi:hypothetical protein
MVNLISSQSDGTWIIGITCGNVAGFLQPAYDYFLESLGLDLSVIESKGKMAFVARKGDPFALELQWYRQGGGCVYLEADIRPDYTGWLSTHTVTYSIIVVE